MCALGATIRSGRGGCEGICGTRHARVLEGGYRSAWPKLRVRCLGGEGAVGASFAQEWRGSGRVVEACVGCTDGDAKRPGGRPIDTIDGGEERKTPDDTILFCACGSAERGGYDGARRTCDTGHTPRTRKKMVFRFTPRPRFIISGDSSVSAPIICVSTTGTGKEGAVISHRHDLFTSGWACAQCEPHDAVTVRGSSTLYSTIQDPPRGQPTHTHTQNRPEGNVHEVRPSRTTLQELSGRLA